MMLIKQTMMRLKLYKKNFFINYTINISVCINSVCINFSCCFSHYCYCYLLLLTNLLKKKKRPAIRRVDSELDFPVFPLMHLDLKLKTRKQLTFNKYIIMIIN